MGLGLFGMRSKPINMEIVNIGKEHMGEDG